MTSKESLDFVADDVDPAAFTDTKAFHRFDVDGEARVGGRTYKLMQWLAVDSILGVDTETGEIKTLDVEDLRPIPLTRAQARQPDRDLSEFTQDQQDMARARLKVVKPLLTQGRTRKQVVAVAKANQVGVATVYRWINRYEAAEHLSALIDAPMGRKAGERKLTAAQEALINAVLDDPEFMKKKPTPKKVFTEVERRCRLVRVPTPHENTVRNRIRQVPQKVTMRRHGRKEEALNLYSPLRGVFPDQRFPYQVVQIDHTPLDIEVVDAITRQSAGRIYLTLAICVTTRMVAGLYLSFDPPNSTSVAACVAHAMCPKRAYLAQLEVPGNWPVWGKMRRIHVDNAKEFRSKALQLGCDKYEIDLSWRPPKRPEFGGHIESLMGVAASKIHELPGTTFSNIQQKKGYDPTKEAVMTLQAVEADLVDYFVNNYHRAVHSDLGMTPMQAWDLGIMGTDNIPGIGPIPIPGDPERIAIDFMPLFERTVQRYGTRIDKLEYYDGVLDPFINATDPNDPKGKRKLLFRFRRDQRNARVYFLDPRTNDYVRIPYRHRGRPDVGIWELNQAKAEIAKQGREVDEEAIFDSINRSRARVDAEMHKSRTARRAHSRRPKGSSPASMALPTTPSATSAPTVAQPAGSAPDADFDALFATPVLPFASRVI